MKYQKSKMRDYITNTQVITVREDFKIRLSDELMKKYKSGIYDAGIAFMLKTIDQINNLNIKYPANSKPIFYIYIVPNEEFRELLNYPSYRNSNGGGKPVISFDLDGFHSAYGVSSNMLENKKEMSLMKEINNIHEFAHLVHSIFFNKDRLILEGFAEALPLYTMDYENKFDEHRDVLKQLNEDQILTAQELILSAANNNFNEGSVIQNKSCSFDYTYISSYLFVRGCMEQISKKYKLDRIQATQKFLEIVMQSDCINQWLIFDIANAIGIDQNELLDGKEMQLNVIKNL